MRGGDNRAVVRRFWREVFDRGNLDVADGLFARDHVLDHPALTNGGRGPEAVKAFVGVFRKMAPELDVTVEEEIANGEKVVTRWSASGQAVDQEGDDDPGVVVSGVAIFRVSDGEIQETWLQFQSLDQKPRLVPKNEGLQSELAGAATLAPIGQEASFGLKCWLRPRTCRIAN